MTDFSLKLSLAAPIMAVSMFLTPSATIAQGVGHLDHSIRLVQGGRMDIDMAAPFVASLTNIGVLVTANDSAEIRGQRIFLPVTAGGSVNITTANMQLLHSGAVIFSGGGLDTITLSSFILDYTGGLAKITVLVSINNSLVGRVPFVNMTAPAGLTLPLAPVAELLQIDLIGLTLDPSMAHMLNSTYHVQAFLPGENMGVANLNVFLL